MRWRRLVMLLSACRLRDLLIGGLLWTEWLSGLRRFRWRSLRAIRVAARLLFSLARRVGLILRSGSECLCRTSWMPWEYFHRRGTLCTTRLSLTGGSALTWVMLCTRRLIWPMG